MKRAARIARVSAGVAVLLIMALIAVALVPPYVGNWKLQRYVNEVVDDPATAQLAEDITREKIVSRAAALGLPVHTSDVQVKRSPEGVRVDVMYVVHVDLAGYTVDLHFRPAGGS